MPHLHNRLEYNRTRRDLRNSATPTEVKLWHYLRGRRLRGYKFRRQHGISAYVIDFYRPKLNLAVEVNGCHHFAASIHARDYQRDAWLHNLGITVIRFTLAEVMNDIDGVLLRLQEVIAGRSKFQDHP